MHVCSDLLRPALQLIKNINYIFNALRVLDLLQIQQMKNLGLCSFKYTDMISIIVSARLVAISLAIASDTQYRFISSKYQRLIVFLAAYQLLDV